MSQNATAKNKNSKLPFYLQKFVNELDAAREKLDLVASSTTDGQSQRLTTNLNATTNLSATVNPNATVSPSATFNPNATVNSHATVNPSATVNSNAPVNSNAMMNSNTWIQQSNSQLSQNQQPAKIQAYVSSTTSTLPSLQLTKLQKIQHADLERQINVTQQQISRQPGLPSVLANSINSQLRHLSQQYNDRQKAMLDDIHKALADTESLRTSQLYAQRQIKIVVGERDAACRERDHFQIEVQRFSARQQHDEQRLEQMERRCKQMRDELNAMLQIQEDQLAGKRSLRPENRPRFDERNTGFTREQEPFNAPTTVRASDTFNAFGKRKENASPIRNSALIEKRSGPISRKQGGKFLNISAPNAWAPSNGKPQHNNKVSDGSSLSPTTDVFNNLKLLPLPSRLAVPSQAPWGPPPSTIGTGAGSRAETGHPSPTGGKQVDWNTKALVPYVPDENVPVEYEEAIGKVYGLIEGWVGTYANIPNNSADQSLPNGNPSLWQFILGLTYTNLQDAHTHAMHLLCEAGLRPWFIMRMAVDYIVRNMWTSTAFMGFDSDTDAELKTVKNKLSEKGKPSLPDLS
jgi:hypothetical protein